MVHQKETPNEVPPKYLEIKKNNTIHNRKSLPHLFSYDFMAIKTWGLFKMEPVDRKCPNNLQNKYGGTTQICHADNYTSHFSILFFLPSPHFHP